MSDLSRQESVERSDAATLSYRARCDCGFLGPLRDRDYLANEDCRDHRDEDVEPNCFEYVEVRDAEAA